MRISDWSSDVCSSDLRDLVVDSAVGGDLFEFLVAVAEFLPPLHGIEAAKQRIEDAGRIIGNAVFALFLVEVLTAVAIEQAGDPVESLVAIRHQPQFLRERLQASEHMRRRVAEDRRRGEDRKRTRLNSSH